jgi:Glyoxalase superfamily protein
MVADQRNISVFLLKSEAKQYRQQVQRGGEAISHSAALEHVAKRYGFHDWNTASAVLSKNDSRLFLGQRVSGRYLGHDFKGILLGLHMISPAETRVEIEFDTPIDVVRFSSFSAVSKRVRGTVRQNGTSIAKISTGEAHLVIDQMQAKAGRTRHGK